MVWLWANIATGHGAKTGNRPRPREAALEIPDLGPRQAAGVPGHERPLSDKVKAVGHRQAHQGHWAEQDEQPNVGGKTKTDQRGRSPGLQWVVGQVEAVTECP